MTPLLSASLVSDEIALHPPRNLKLPVRCRHSAFIRIRRPARSFRVSASSKGVTPCGPLQAASGGVDIGDCDGFGHGGLPLNAGTINAKSQRLSRRSRIAPSAAGSFRRGICPRPGMIAWRRSGLTAIILSRVPWLRISEFPAFKARTGIS